MFERALHLGTEHPNLLWLVVVGVLTFAGGIAIGLRSRLREDTPDTAPAPDSE